MTQTAPSTDSLSVTLSPQGASMSRAVNGRKIRHAIAEANPNGHRFITACGRAIYGYTAPRESFPVTCKTCTAKDA